MRPKSHQAWNDLSRAVPAKKRMSSTTCMGLINRGCLLHGSIPGGWQLRQRVRFVLWPRSPGWLNGIDAGHSRNSHKVCHRDYPHLLHDSAAMNLDGFFRRAEFVGDLLI